MKTRSWVLLFAALAAVLLAFWLLLPQGGGTQVGIYQDGTLLYVLTPEETVQTVTVEGAAGVNVIEVSTGGVRVVSAQCPDQLCVRHGDLRENALPIVCLPNRLSIRWINAKPTQIDAVSGAGG